MAEKNKAQLIEEINGLQAQIEKMATDAGIGEVMKSKDDKIAELTEALDQANSQVIELTKINEELSTQNKSVVSESGNIVEFEGEKHECIAQAFYHQGKKITLEELRKNKTKASVAKELGYLVPLTEK